MKRLLWIYCFVVFFARPLSAQPIPPDFHAWFSAQVAGRPFGQQTLLDIAPLLPCVGSQLTPPNAAGDRTKIWDPTIQQWVRVGFGEGSWVYIPQGPSEAPAPVACVPVTPPIPPSPSVVPPLPSLDLSAVLGRLDALGLQHERIFANLTAQLDQLRAQVEAHDKKPGELSQILGNRYVQIALGALGTCVSTQCWK